MLAFFSRLCPKLNHRPPRSSTRKDSGTSAMLSQRSQVRTTSKLASWQRQPSRSNSARAAKDRPALQLETVIESVQPLAVPSATAPRAAQGGNTRAKRGTYRHQRSPSLPSHPVATDQVEHLQQRLRAELSLRQSHVPALALRSRIVQTPSSARRALVKR